MRLEWSALAVEDRSRIFDYIEPDSPRAAIAVDERIRNHVSMLARFPESGRPGRVEGTREMTIVGTPYLAVYRILDDRVRILRVLHGAMHWPEDPPGIIPPR